jgi:hypothetical protein
MLADTVGYHIRKETSRPLTGFHYSKSLFSAEKTLANIQLLLIECEQFRSQPFRRISELHELQRRVKELKLEWTANELGVPTAVTILKDYHYYFASIIKAYKTQNKTLFPQCLAIERIAFDQVISADQIVTVKIGKHNYIINEDITHDQEGAAIRQRLDVEIEAERCKSINAFYTIISQAIANLQQKKPTLPFFSKWSAKMLAIQFALNHVQTTYTNNHPRSLTEMFDLQAVGQRSLRQAFAMERHLISMDPKAKSLSKVESELVRLETGALDFFNVEPFSGRQAVRRLSC